ncbi:hypothetical protein HMPREF1129_2582 [Actinomyces naeslundii str. Howell 279]|uniref:Uncharacterized protein n=1 Tax=Actinomyces naeslundii (strain ATCC 12104 / DSM 43013 / CCUG 2238 / JCM 8349 / NCTC 10301 / Howell 279) TaxID=1115803 RepID=J3A9E3_ACTNH|nr:hypothetical protein HMPREF1129_2582 [Actinomyces naeslundii str. Howell 279]
MAGGRHGAILGGAGSRSRSRSEALRRPHRRPGRSVHARRLPDEVRAALETEPIMLPSWDPMA